VTGAVAALGTLGGERPQPAHLRVAVGHRPVGQAGGDKGEVEGTRCAQLRRPLDDTRVAGKAAELLGARAQVGGRPRRQPAVDLVEAAPGAHSGQGGGEVAPLGDGVVHVVGGDDLDPLVGGELDEGVVAGRVERVTVVPHLDDDVLTPERLDQVSKLAAGRRRAMADQGGGHGALAAPGEHAPVPLWRPVVGGGAPSAAERGGDPGGGAGGEPGGRQVAGLGPDPRQGAQVEAGGAFLPRPLAGADGSPEPGVALGAPGQHDQVGALGVGHPALGLGGAEGELGPEHRRQPHHPGRLGEADHAVVAVVIGEGERLEAQAVGFLDQLLRVGGPVQEAEVGVAVQLGVGDTGNVTAVWPAERWMPSGLGARARPVAGVGVGDGGGVGGGGAGAGAGGWLVGLALA